MTFSKSLHTPKRRQPGNPVASIRSFIPIAFLALLASGSAVGAVAVGTTLPQAAVGQPYNHILSASGGTSPYNHIVSSGIVPGGITLSASGVLSGTPQNAGLFNFVVQSTDALNVTGVTNLSLRVAASSGLEITNLTIPAGRMGTMYDVALAAQGGASPYAWDLILNGGSIPPGLTFSSSGRITGSPTSGGIYPIIARVTDANGNSFQSALTLRIDASQFSIITNSLASASANVPYSQGIAASGGTAPYTFDVLSGTLTPGLTLSTGGVISGTPTSAGVFNFVIRGRDAGGLTAQSNFSMTVSGTGPRVVVSSLPTGILNQIYNASLVAQGGTSPYSFSILNGSLPPGLTLNLSGVIAGTPTAIGVYPVTIRLGDATGQFSQADILININSTSFNITSATAPDGFVNVSYSFSLASAGGTAPVNYTILSGTLPAGLVLNSNGTISGTATTAGTFPVVVRATDAAGGTAQTALNIRIQSSALTISQEGLANAQRGQPYSSTLSAMGGAAPFTFNLVSGSLPAGLTLGTNGNISGTPTASGLYFATFRVLDSNQRSSEITLPIFVSGSGLSVTTLSLPSARPNQAYSTMLLATGGMTPYTFQVSSGTLPAGLTLSSTGLLSGNLTQNTNGAFTVRVTDAAGATSVVSYVFNVNSSNLALSSTAPATGLTGQLYSTTFTSSGGTGATTYSIDGGALPPGLSLSSSGTLSGTPTAPGVYVFNIKATDGGLVSNLFSQVVTINSSQLGFTSTTLPDITLGTQYFATFTGVGGTSPYTFTLVSGTLPPGLTLAANGNITGSATASGSYPITIRITDSTGASATTAPTLIVNAGGALSIVTSALASARRGEAYTSLVVATGGRAPYTFELGTGAALPAGLSLSPAGLITGIPTTDGTSSFVIRTQDANGNVAQKTLTLSVGSGSLNITNQAIPNGTVGNIYSVPLLATGGVPVYSFVVSSGTLPPGLSLSGSGVLSGTPTTSGSFPIVIRLGDSTGAEFQKSYTILVGSSALSFTNISLPVGYLGQNYRVSLFSFGGVQPYKYSVSTGTLPAGLTLSDDGIISGVPNVSGQSTVTFRVSDASGAIATNTLVMGIIQSTIGFGFTSIPNATVGQGYGFTPTGGSGTAPFRFSVLGGLPPGISVRPDGALTGVPTQSGAFNVLYRAQDATGAIVEGSFPFTVMAASFRISSLTLPDSQLGQPYSQTLTSTGGTGAVSFTLQSGTLPAGLQLSNSGLISGTATVAGSYPITIRATDSNNVSTTSVLTLLVSGPIVNFITNSLPSGTVNQIYNQTLVVSGGTGPYSFVLNTGTLPAGLTLSSTGVISGTPTASGNFAFNVRATDCRGQPSTTDYVIGIGTVGAPMVNAVVSAANYAGNGVAPGEIVVIYGSNVGPVQLMRFSVANNMVGTTLGGTRVLFDGVAAPVVYTSANQVAAVVPFSVAGKTNVRITVEYMGAPSAVLQVPVRLAKPAIFTIDSSGNGAGAILNQDGTLNSALNPEEKSRMISLFVTGVGQTNPASQDGQIILTMAPLATTLTATVNGQAAEIQYAGNAPGMIPGLAQINLRIPSGASSGMNTIQITVGSTGSTGNVTVFVK